MEIKELEVSLEKTGWRDFTGWPHHLSSSRSQDWWCWWWQWLWHDNNDDNISTTLYGIFTGRLAPCWVLPAWSRVIVIINRWTKCYLSRFTDEDTEDREVTFKAEDDTVGGKAWILSWARTPRLVFLMIVLDGFPKNVSFLSAGLELLSKSKQENTF